MDGYEIRIKVELIKTDDIEKKNMLEKGRHGYTMHISDDDASDIDKCESAVLRTAHPAIREALSEHLTALSKKKTEKWAGAGQEIIENERRYKVDGEAGRFEFTTHSVLQGGEVLFNTAGDLFFELHARELYRTVGFKEIAMIYGDTRNSFRETSRLINRIRHQEIGGTPYRSLQYCTEKEGAEVFDYTVEKSNRILKENGFDETDEDSKDMVKYAEGRVAVLPSEQIAEEALGCCRENIELEALLANPVCYEDHSKSVNISIDDVIVKKQKEKRDSMEDAGEKKRKYVHDTVVHTQTTGGRYTLVGRSMKEALRFLTALLFNNGLIGYRFQFFTDGHTVLNETILKAFDWYPNMGIILDWFHLVKKCKEKLSLGLKGRKYRNEELRKIMPLLWLGLVDEAINTLREIDASTVKNEDAVEKLVEYLERNRLYIPCYAVRKQLGLCNSSAIGEKMNDLLVSKRQKHNGMSWSKKGSSALAVITTLERNKESTVWFERKELDFLLAA